MVMTDKDMGNYIVEVRTKKRKKLPRAIVPIVPRTIDRSTNMVGVKVHYKLMRS